MLAHSVINRARTHSRIIHRDSRSLIRRSIWLALLPVTLMATACSAVFPTTSADHVTATPTPTPIVFFPQQAPVQGAQSGPAALLLGKLVKVDRCLRVTGGTGPGALIIWPAYVRLHIDQETIQIRDPAGNTIAQIGDDVQLLGGEVKEDTIKASRELRRTVPRACPGPYWLAGGIVRRSEAVDPAR